MSGILITCLLIMSSLVSYGQGSDTILTEEMGLQPEVLVTAPRFHDENTDSIGTMPGIIVYGERYQPEDEQNLIVTYRNFRRFYHAATQFVVRYGIYLAVGIATLTWGVIVYSRYIAYAHEPHVHSKEKEESALHKYYRRCQRNKEQWHVL